MKHRPALSPMVYLLIIAFLLVAYALLHTYGLWCVVALVGCYLWYKLS